MAATTIKAEFKINDDQVNVVKLQVQYFIYQRIYTNLTKHKYDRSTSHNLFNRA